MLGTEGMKIFDFDNIRSLEMALSGKELRQNYFYLLKSTKTTKTTSQKCWRNIIWADFLRRLYDINGIKTRLGSPVSLSSTFCIPVFLKTSVTWVKVHIKTILIFITSKQIKQSEKQEKSSLLILEILIFK